MDINQIGLLVGYQRVKLNVSTGELSEGICSSSYMARLETGKRGCEKIVAEALLQRVGFASDQLLYFLDKAEYHWLMIKEKLLTAISDLDTDAASTLMKEYYNITYGKSKLHTQFMLLAECVLEWNLYLNGRREKEDTLKFLEKKLILAWEGTREPYDIAGACPKFLDFQELMLKILYYHVMEEREQYREALDGYRGVLHYVETRMESIESVKFYPQLAYRMLLLMEKLGGMEQEEEALYAGYRELIKKEGSMIRLSEMAEYRKRFLLRKTDSSSGLQEIEELEELIETLDWLYETYGVRKKDWFTNVLFGREEVYPLTPTIKKRRICLDLTQEDLADGVCDPVSISRIETGTSHCTLSNVGLLFDKLRLPDGAAVFSVQTGRADLYEVAAEIKRLSLFSRYEEAEGLFEQLTSKKVNSDCCIEQYRRHKDATLQRNLKRIDNEEHWKRQKEALHLTVPDKPVSELKEWVFTRTEAMIVNSLAYGCKQIGKAAEAREWLELVKDYYEEQPVHWYHYFRGYELTLRNLGSILDQTQEYERAIKYDDIAIRLALDVGEASVLRATIYDCGWNMEQLWESGKYTKEDSRPYVRAAVLLNRIYAKPASAAFIEQEWLDRYGN